MPVDQETAFHIRQAFADLGLRPRDAAIEPPPLTQEMIQRDVRTGFAELDPQQWDILQRMTPAERFALVCDLNKFLRTALIEAIHEQRPGLDEVEFQREFLKRVGIQLPTDRDLQS